MSNAIAACIGAAVGILISFCVVVLWRVVTHALDQTREPPIPEPDPDIDFSFPDWDTEHHKLHRLRNPRSKP